jgi:hypothetical protein
MANDEQVLENELMPNSGEIAAPGIFIDDAEQNQIAPDEERQEESTMAVSQPLIADLMLWFDEQIAVADSVEQAHKTLKLYNKALAKGRPHATLDDVLVAHDILRTLLDDGKDDLQSRYDAFTKKREADDGEEA